MRTVDIEYVGDPPLMDDVTQLRIAMGELPPMGAQVIRAAETQRRRPVEGITKRVVDPEWFGTSRQYVFGPHGFVTAVDACDVDKILGDPGSGHQFRRKGDTGLQVVLPPSDIALVEEVDGVSLRDIYR